MRNRLSSTSAFAQLMELFKGLGSKAEVLSEVFWASLHGLADLTRTKRLPQSRHKDRVKRSLRDLLCHGKVFRSGALLPWLLRSTSGTAVSEEDE